MTTKYILDLNTEEYRDNYVENQEHEFWQPDARDSLLENLIITVNEAKSYKAQREKNNKTWLSHNAILVSGQRGTGKTVFLRNCEDIWKKEFANNSDGKMKELYFLQEIDPTMLLNEDNFSNVVIALIYSEVEQTLQSENCCGNPNTTLNKHKSTFHKALKKLADSLGKLDDFNGFTGIDKIQQYKSGIHIQTYFHEFIEAAIDILGCRALVLPIDDVDMALDRAFEVVDDVRRLLGCPYIIPIVSGDYRLYQQMTHVHFDEKSYRDESSNTELEKEGQELAKQLSKAYLTKIFPNQMRINLLPITEITPALLIKQKHGGEITEYTYKEYKNYLFQKFYSLCHNKEALHNWPEPESSRELTQLIRAMSPIQLVGSLYDNDDKANNRLWNNYISWAEQKQNGVAFTNASSYLTLVNRENHELFDIQELANFNPKKQMNKELYPWAKKEFYNQQLSALGFTSTSSNGNNNKNILDSAFDEKSYTLRSMPPLEFIDSKSFVTLKTIEKAISEAEQVNTSCFLFDGNPSKEVVNDAGSTQHTEPPGNIEFKIEQILFDLYTHGDTYSSLGNTYQYVFMSRAFEIIFYSFINDSPENQQINLLNILNKTPFYSVFNIAPTKTIVGEGSVEDEDSTLIDNKVKTSEVLNELILNWKKKHRELFSSFDTKSLVSIFSYMFNKTFTSFNIFKQAVFLKQSFGNDVETSEHLTDLAKRFEYILINSAYTAAIQGVAVQANVAFTRNQKTIRSVSAFNSSDRVLTRNKNRFKQEIEQSAKSQSPKDNLLGTADFFIKAIEDHPIFTLIQQEEDRGTKGIDITIPAKIKMGNKDANSIPEELRKKAEEYLNNNNNKNILKNIKAVTGFISKIEKIPTAIDFYQKNELGSMIELQKLEQISGNREHNFIVALIKTFKKK